MYLNGESVSWGSQHSMFTMTLHDDVSWRIRLT